jgi:peptide/nickel transport system substrate-binding protein
LLLRTLLPCLEPLLRYDANGNLQGYLAQSWQVADDGKSITFKLRQGIKFQDGTPFNADAVKYNLEATYKSAVMGSAVLSVVKGYDIIDDYTIRMNLSGFDYRLMSSLATAVGLIASPTALKKPATPDNIAQLHMVGTGPFIFNSWKRDDFVKYTRNPNYWVSGQPYLDSVNIMYIADRTVAVMAFRSGVANRIEGVDPVNADLLEKLGFKVYVLGLRFQHAMMYDSKNPNSPFANAKVRDVLNYAIDKATLIQGIGGGAARGYTALNEMAEPNNPWFVPNLPVKTFDLAKAKQLLTEAGYPNGFKTKLTTNTLVEQDWIQAIQAALAKVGITVTVDVADVPRFTSVTMSGWDGLVHPGFPTFETIGGLYARWGDPAQFVSMYRPPDWNDTWQKVLTVTDETTRMNLMKQLVTEDYQQVIGFSYRANAPLGADAGDVHNFQLHVGGSMDVWWPEQIWVDKK